MKKKKKKGLRPKGLVVGRPEERRRFIPVAPAVTRQQDLDINQADKTPLPITCAREVIEGLRGERGVRKVPGRGGMIGTV